MMGRSSLVPFIGFCLSVFSAHVSIAHELRPAYLDLRETGEDTYALVWKKPAGEMRLDIAPVIPEGCRVVQRNSDSAPITPVTVITRGTLICSGGLSGKTLRVSGLQYTGTDVLVRIQHRDGRTESHLLKPVSPSVTLGVQKTWFDRSWSYLRLGVEHILLGIDHLLFVLGLLLIVPNGWMLAKTITAFTIAHSITLSLATLGYVSAPIAPLNATIALSILFLGPEIIRRWRGQTSFTIRHPWIVAFAFGLLHGLGFASGLSAMGLPTAEIPLALLLFNLGVEAGQMLFVALILLLLAAFRALGIAWPRPVKLLPGYVVGSLGAFWTIQRTMLLLVDGK